ncbi:hypothetical protein F5X96DRAFT_630094 [Biscogniauxia mediterranea]|nr:hypothetical protein F5X96DRAFT_630094 [Biscogniauxia mediterranea]
MYFFFFVQVLLSLFHPTRYCIRLLFFSLPLFTSYAYGSASHPTQSAAPKSQAQSVIGLKVTNLQRVSTKTPSAGRIRRSSRNWVVWPSSA